MRELMDAVVRAGSAGRGPDAPAYDGPVLGAAHLAADRRHALLTVRGVGRFAIEDGQRVCVEADPEADEQLLTGWLHGTVAALLLAQRGRFALHASVVNVGGAGVALSGRRRAGKSTTALRLAQRGDALVTDDVTPLELGDDLTVQPFARAVHVHRDAADQLGLDVSEASTRHAKLVLPGPDVPPIALGAIVVLRRHGEDPVEAARVTGARAHRIVAGSAYRAQLLRRIWEAELFGWASAVVARVPVFRIVRPEEGWTVEQVADAVEAVAGKRLAAGNGA